MSASSMGGFSCRCMVTIDFSCRSSPCRSAWWTSAEVSSIPPSCFSGSCVRGGSIVMIDLLFSRLCYPGAGSCWSGTFLPMISPLFSPPYCSIVRSLAASMFLLISLSRAYCSLCMRCFLFSFVARYMCFSPSFFLRGVLFATLRALPFPRFGVLSQRPIWRFLLILLVVSVGL